jgi:hypothetical protein
VAGAPLRKKNWWPMSPFPSPNMKAKPMAQNSRPHRQVSTMHSSRMFTVSRDRAKPASRAMNPACMKKTRNAAIKTHIVLMGLMTSGRWTTTCPRAASAGERKYQFKPVNRPSTAMTPSILPAKITAHRKVRKSDFTQICDL